MPNPTATIFLPYHALDDVILRGPRASQPLASAVTPGTLYCVTDEGTLVERSNGTVWERYSPSGATAAQPYDYVTAVTAPPAAREIRFNAGHPYTAVTTVWVRRVNAAGLDLHAVLMNVQIGGAIYVQDRGDSTLYAQFTTTADPVDAGDYVTFAVSWKKNGGVLINNQAVDVVFSGGGAAAGAPGPHAATHSAGAGDPVTVTNLAGYPGGTANFLRADGAFAPPPTAGIVREIPTGSLDGSNITFTLANTPIANSEEVYLNGLLQDARGIDYSISGAVVTFLIPPLSGDRLLVTYQRI